MSRAIPKGPLWGVLSIPLLSVEYSKKFWSQVSPGAAHSQQFWADLESLCLILPGINIFYISWLARKTRLCWTFVTWSQWGYYLVTQGQILSFQFWQGNGLGSLSSRSETQIFNSGFHVIISHAWLFEISHQDKNKKDVPTNENKYSSCFMNMNSNDKKETSKASQDFSVFSNLILQQSQSVFGKYQVQML